MSNLKQFRGDCIHCGADPIAITSSHFNDKTNTDSCLVTGHWYLRTKSKDGYILQEHPSGARSWAPWLAVPKHVLMEIGGFDERFTTWGAEDADIANRLVRYGLRRIPHTSLVAIHLDDIRTNKSNQDAEQLQKQRQVFLAEKSIVRNKGKNWGCLDT